MIDFQHHHHRGKVFVGRVVVVVACVLLLGANALVFRAAAAPPRPVPSLKVVSVISLIWIFAGAWCMCTRKGWARYLVLTLLYTGSFGFFLAGVITLTTTDGILWGRLEPIFIATAVYLLVSLVLTHSKHVRRLTSRAFE